VRYLNPVPQRLGELLARFKTVLVPELNLGQLALLLRAQYGIKTVSLTKVRGQPFTISEIIAAAKTHLPVQLKSLVA
jgi:2-oxoglutarate ferredoxin oxidoreductase subunit alpha